MPKTSATRQRDLEQKQKVQRSNDEYFNNGSSEFHGVASPEPRSIVYDR